MVMDLEIGLLATRIISDISNYIRKQRLPNSG